MAGEITGAATRTMEQTARAFGAPRDYNQHQGQIDDVTREVLLPRRADLQAKGTTEKQRMAALDAALNYGREHNIDGDVVWEAVRRYGRGADFQQLQREHHHQLMDQMGKFFDGFKGGGASTGELEKMLKPAPNVPGRDALKRP